MNTSIYIIIFYIVIISLKAVSDGLSYLGWTTHKQIYGGLWHVFSEVLIFFSILTGYWINSFMDLKIVNSLMLLLGAVMFNFAYFDLIRAAVVGKYTQGKTAFWDRLVLKFGIKSNTTAYHIVRITIGFIAGVIIVLYFK